MSVRRLNRILLIIYAAIALLVLLLPTGLLGIILGSIYWYSTTEHSSDEADSTISHDSARHSRDHHQSSASQ